jgi:antibiotic biosynthesis monooxygenase (ABM) superfamily enzyme
MVLTFLNPLMHNLSFAVQMLIGNILSVALLTWLVMPRVSQFLNFWLAPVRDWKNEALGLFTVAAGLVLFVLIFQAV